MKKALVFLLSLSLLFSACTPSGISNKPEKTVVNCTFTGSQSGSMFWNVSGAHNKPSPLWTYHEKDTFSMWYYAIGNLNVCKDAIYVGGYRLTAINLKTGKELWETQLKNSSPRENANTFILYPTVYGDKIVAIGARLVVEKGFDYYFERRNVLVFERKTGKLLWKSTDIGAKLEYFDSGYPAILNNKIYVPALNGEYRASEYGYGNDLGCKDEERGIWVWDLNTGKILRKIILPIPKGELDISSTLIRVYRGNIYITAGTSAGPLYLIAFDTLRNKVLWQTQITDEMGAYIGINLFGVNSRVVAMYQRTDPTKLHGVKEELDVFDRNTGKLLWSKGVYGDIDIALTEDYLFAQTSVDTVTCFNALNGKEIWNYKFSKFKLSADAYSYYPRFTPFLTKDVLYLIDHSIMVALKPDNGHKLWDIAPLFPEVAEGNGDRSWRFIPVDDGFVILYIDLPMSGDVMLHPPIIQLWSGIDGKK